MEIKEAQLLQKKLEGTIGRMFDEFHSATGLSITDIGINKINVTNFGEESERFLNLVWVQTSI
jgi:hypothetical protein